MDLVSLGLVFKERSGLKFLLVWYLRNKVDLVSLGLVLKEQSGLSISDLVLKEQSGLSISWFGI